MHVLRGGCLVLEPIGRPDGDAGLDRASHLVQLGGRGGRDGEGGGLPDGVARDIHVSFIDFFRPFP